MVGHGFVKVFAVGAVAAALAFAGCGDDSEETAGQTGGNELSSAAYAKQAEAICRKADKERNAKIAKLAKEIPQSASLDEKTEALAQTVKPIFAGMVSELEKIQPPAGSEGDDYRVWMEAVELAVEKIDASDSEAINASVSAHHKATAAGLKDCSTL
jgi:hypothetical protein